CAGRPERRDSDQRCVLQIEMSPSETRPKTIASRFFSNERCAICRRPIGPLGSTALQPGFMDPATRNVETWDDVAPQDLPRAIATWRPLCSTCALAESFRQRSPDRVTDRPPP